MNSLSTCWQNIQRLLFPHIENGLGPLTERQKRLVAILELVRIEDFIPAPASGLVGRPPEDRQAMARAFVAKMVFERPSTKALIAQLREDSNLRQICGWEKRQEVSSETSFSRAFDDFAAISLPHKVHAALIEQHEKPRLVGHLSRDATAIHAGEKPVRKKKEPKPKYRRGRPRKDEQRPAKEPSRLDRQMAGISLEAMLADRA